MRRFLLSLLLFLALVSGAEAQKTRAALTTEINTNFADNTAGAITPALARTTYLDMLASWQAINTTAPGDAAYPMVAGDRYVYTTVLTTARTWTLPPASSLNKGEHITVADAANVVTSSNTITIARNGSDTISGATTSVVLNYPLVSAIFVTDGVSNWGVFYNNQGLAAANTVIGNFSASTALAVANAVASCSGNNNGVLYTTNTGFSCGSNFAYLNVADQTITGGANVTSQSQSTGSIQIDCGSRPLQFITNGGAFTLTAPANDGSCILLVTNNASAGTITFSGFSVGASTGDALTTTNTNKFSIHIWRINSISGYRIAAHQ